MAPQCIVRLLRISLLVLLATAAHGGEAAHETNRRHADFDAVLEAHVVDGFVDYGAIAADGRFADYVDFLEAPLPGGLSRDQQLAYWINAYNALSIQGILGGHSPDSLFGRWRFFKGVDYAVGGRTLNLYDLEHDVIIPLGEPRSHFAIVCASASCPPLRSAAYTAERLEEQLEDQAARFLNDPALNRYDADRAIAYLSKIFDWYEGEFEASASSVQKFIARYIDDDSIRADLAADRYRVRYLDYDWSLNGSAPQD